MWTKRLFIILAIPILFSCEKTEPEPDLPQSGIIEYQVTCNPSGFNTVYRKESGITGRMGVSGGGWGYSFTANREDFISITAKSKNKNATVSVMIIYCGEVIRQSSNNGDFASVTASVTL